MDLTAFNGAVDDVSDALPLIGTALVGVTVLSLGVTLAISYVKRIRSAI